MVDGADVAEADSAKPSLHPVENERPEDIESSQIFTWQTWPLCILISC